MSEYRKLAGNTFLVSTATFLSRILGLVREVVISSLFGLGKTTDAFFLAFTIPNLLRQLLGEGAFSNSFIPIYSDVLKKGDKKREEEFLSSTFTFLLVSLVFVSFLGIIFAPLLIKIFAPGFTRDSILYENAVKLLRILFPYILFISLTAFLYGILNTHRSFFYPALTPVWLNISMILFSLLLWRFFGIYALAIGVIFGGIFQFLFLLPFVRRMGISFSLSLSFLNPDLLRVLALIVPAILAVVVNQLNVVVDRIFASLLEIGSLSALYYSNRLVQFPIGVFGIALSTVFFPFISGYKSKGEDENFSTYVSLGIRTGAFMLIPFSFYLFLFSFPIISFIYEHGIFTTQNAEMTSYALKFYSIGIFFISGANFLTRVFYSTKDSKTPMYISIFSVFINIVFDVILMQYMSYRGLALATSIAGIVNFSLLLFFLFKKRHIAKLREYLISFGKIIASCAIITGVSLFFLNKFSGDLWYGFFMPTILFFSGYFIILYFIRSPELKFLVSFIKRGA